MAKQYTPTTDQVRDFWVSHGARMPAAKGYREDECAAEFDRWLAAHDAQVLRDAALSGDFGTTAQSTLLRRADRIAGGTSA